MLVLGAYGQHEVMLVLGAYGQSQVVLVLGTYDQSKVALVLGAYGQSKVVLVLATYGQSKVVLVCRRIVVRCLQEPQLSTFLIDSDYWSGAMVDPVSDALKLWSQVGIGGKHPENKVEHFKTHSNAACKSQLLQKHLVRIYLSMHMVGWQL